MPSNCAMPTFEIVAEEPALDSGTPATLPAKERKTRVRRSCALGLTDHVRLLLPFLAVGVLGVLLEMFSARLLVERVSEGLAQRLIGRGLPAELQAPIRDIVGTDLVRDHFVKSYAFSNPEDGYVKLDIEVRYELRNYSEAARDYAPEIAAEILFQPEFRFLAYGIAGRKIHTFSDENLSPKVETVIGRTHSRR